MTIVFLRIFLFLLIVIKAKTLFLMSFRIFIWLIIWRTSLKYFVYLVKSFKWYIFFVNWFDKFLYKCMILSSFENHKKFIVNVKRAKNFSKISFRFLALMTKSEKNNCCKKVLCLFCFFFFEYVAQILDKFFELFIWFWKIRFCSMSDDCLRVVTRFVFDIINFLSLREKVVLIDLNFCDKMSFSRFSFCCVFVKKRQLWVFMFEDWRVVDEAL